MSALSLEKMKVERSSGEVLYKKERDLTCMLFSETDVVTPTNAGQSAIANAIFITGEPLARGDILRRGQKIYRIMRRIRSPLGASRYLLEEIHDEDGRS